MKSGSPPSTHPDPELAQEPAHDDALVEFEVLADASHAEALGDALVQAGAMAVSIEDAQADSPAEQPLYGEPDVTGAMTWRLNRLKVLIGPEQDPGRILAEAAASAGISHPVVQASRALTDRDWVLLSQSQFAPVQVGRLWIVPTWAEPPDPDALVLRLDPGMAFGTGTHPTTRLCLQWLQELDLNGMSVLDYGCGSGILAIAAAKLGAERVRGIDVDPLACRAARANSRRNDVSADYTLPESTASPAAHGRFDVIVANILANPLIVLAPVLLAQLDQGGRLALSGVLDQQADALIDAYHKVDPRLSLSVWRRDGDWVCLSGQRSGQSADRRADQRRAGPEGAG